MAPAPSTTAASPPNQTFDLAGGLLSLRVDRADIPFDELCAVASRRNPRRGFLFVSKVLGRHWPACPLAMRRVHALLAARLPADLPGPVVFVALAETALVLGSGVRDEYVRATGRADCLLLHTTRHRLPAPVLARFREEHSHAPEHRVHEPANLAHRALLAGARTLVPVDDEASTGDTLLALARAMAPRMPALGHVACAVITDWRGPARVAAWAQAMPAATATMACLLEGEYTFEPGSPPEGVDGGPERAAAAPAGDGPEHPGLTARDFARLGTLHRPPADGPGGRALPWALPAPRPAAPRPGDAPVLVLGTGEFTYPPFLLAEALARAGHDVRCQATTRSPIRPGGPISRALAFPDSYGEGVGNFLYNVSKHDYSLILACYETAPGPTHAALESELDAVAVTYGPPA